LRSRCWFGNMAYPETVDTLVFARLVNAVIASTPFKWMRLSAASARALWVHTSQEMHCLREILPHYYRTCQEERFNAAMGAETASTSSR
jgi:hypothetical protein